VTQWAVLGLDGGQTACKACLMGLDGTVLAQSRGGAVDHLTNEAGRLRSRRAVLQALEGLRTGLNGRTVQVAIASVGFSGLTPAGETYVREWIASVFAVERFLISHDAPVNLAGACAGRVPVETVVVIAGGGSVAWALAPDGRVVMSGGWGHAFGDEGSGWQIGRCAVIAALRAQDGRGPASALVSAVSQHFGAPDPAAVKDRYYAGAIGDADLAGLTPTVAAAAEAGDRVASEILASAGAELGQAAAAVLQRLMRLDKTSEVYTTGGVFRAGSVLWDAFVTTVQARAPHAQVRHARFEPVIGAALLGLQALGVEVTDALTAHIDG